MADKEKITWAGDNGDNKCAKISGEVRSPGYEFTSDDVPADVLDDWKAKGLVTVGANSAPVVIKDTDATDKLDAEIARLKTDLEGLSALRKKNEELEKVLDKAKSGKKAEALKTLESKLKECEQDVQEKDALIKKQAEEIEGLKKDLDDATAPNESGGPQ